MNLSKIRSHFPALKKYTYLDTASGAPLSKDIAAEGIRFYKEMLKYGDIPYYNWLDQIELIRIKVAKFINAHPSEIAFTINTSHGMNLISDMFDNMDEIITMQDEFPSTTFPWLKRKFKLNFVKPDNFV